MRWTDFSISSTLNSYWLEKAKPFPVGTLSSTLEKIEMHRLESFMHSYSSNTQFSSQYLMFTPITSEAIITTYTTIAIVTATDMYLSRFLNIQLSVLRLLPSLISGIINYPIYITQLSTLIIYSSTLIIYSPMLITENKLMKSTTVNNKSEVQVGASNLIAHIALVQHLTKEAAAGVEEYRLMVDQFRQELHAFSNKINHSNDEILETTHPLIESLYVSLEKNMLDQKEQNLHFQEQITDLKKQKSIISQMIVGTTKRNSNLLQEVGPY